MIAATSRTAKGIIWHHNKILNPSKQIHSIHRRELNSQKKGIMNVEKDTADKLPSDIYDISSGMEEEKSPSLQSTSQSTTTETTTTTNQTTTETTTTKSQKTNANENSRSNNIDNNSNQSNGGRRDVIVIDDDGATAESSSVSPEVSIICGCFIFSILNTDSFYFNFLLRNKLFSLAHSLKRI